MRAFFRSIIIFLSLPALLLFSIWGAEVYVTKSTQGFITGDITDVQSRPDAVIFGAGIIAATGEVGPILKARMDAGIALYTAGKVQRLILSGDSQTKGHDEVTPMAKYAKEQGVPESDLLLDGKGVGTYETCWRLKEVTKATSVVLVTNEYHLPRAIYTCRTLGVDAQGYITPNYPGYEYGSTQRESLARVKMLIDLYIARPQLVP